MASLQSIICFVGVIEIFANEKRREVSRLYKVLYVLLVQLKYLQMKKGAKYRVSTA